MTQKQLDYWKKEGSLLSRFAKNKEVIEEHHFEKRGQVKREIQMLSLCQITEVSILTLVEWKSKYALLLEYKGACFPISLDCTWSDQRNLKGTGLRYNYQPDDEYVLYIHNSGRLLYSKRVPQVVDEYSAITDEIAKELREYLDYFISEVDKIPNKIQHIKKSK